MQKVCWLYSYFPDGESPRQAKTQRQADGSASKIDLAPPPWARYKAAGGKIPASISLASQERQDAKPHLDHCGLGACAGRKFFHACSPRRAPPRVLRGPLFRGR